MAATAKQQAAFEELSQGGGFVNPVSTQLAPVLTGDVFTFFSTIDSNSFLASPPLTPEGGYLGATTQADVIAYRNALLASMPEFSSDRYSYVTRQESPTEDPLFALTKIPGITSGSTAASLIEHTDKYFGNKRGAPFAYYKSGLPPILIRLASAKSVNDVMNELDLRNGSNEQVYPADPGISGFPAGYFAYTFPLLDTPTYQASIPVLTGNTWYDEMVGTISGVLTPTIQTVVDYYTVTLPTNHSTFLSSLSTAATTLALITNYTTFDMYSSSVSASTIGADYTTVVAADPAKTAERDRCDAQVLQENLRYYAHSFVMLNQGSVSTGFYQYKNDPNAYAILSSCASPTMLDALNEVVTF